MPPACSMLPGTSPPSMGPSPPRPRSAEPSQDPDIPPTRSLCAPPATARAKCAPWGTGAATRAAERSLESAAAPYASTNWASGTMRWPPSRERITTAQAADTPAPRSAQGSGCGASGASPLQPEKASMAGGATVGRTMEPLRCIGALPELTPRMAGCGVPRSSVVCAPGTPRGTDQPGCRTPSRPAVPTMPGRRGSKRLAIPAALPGAVIGEGVAVELTPRGGASPAVAKESAPRPPPAEPTRPPGPAADREAPSPAAARSISSPKAPVDD
mmetsp:Transcript_163/g.481  ORF Transcript_163/g.481 Transcript_163/m.481 type:complete len:271 (-) Transcript_163:658-1470(-)